VSQRQSREVNHLVGGFPDARGQAAAEMSHRLLLSLWSRLPNWSRSRLSWLLSAKLNVGVVAIILRHGTHVLLAEHTYKPRAPWQLPGGFLKAGAQPAEGLRRELAEELGLVMETCRIIHAETWTKRQVTLDYRVEATGTFRPSAEISALQPFPLDGLPATLPADQRRALLLATSPDS
jgi:ADP-ribose pyrophosphatase YjhB (NUDIX family)